MEKMAAARKRAPGAGRPAEVAETHPITVTLDKKQLTKSVSR
jgi:hypothetical protein